VTLLDIVEMAAGTSGAAETAPPVNTTIAIAPAAVRILPSIDIIDPPLN